MVTREEIQKIALLSKLLIPEEELDGLTADMQDIIAFADTIRAAEDLADPDFDSISGACNAFREDEVLPSRPPEEILQNVGGGEDSCFPVRRRM
ncbi:MAG: Asp-tRNA(Asn)/Glu-tRNA(Gln) amidotransferase subunit GatC [Oscillospiraceae bacterium]|nr:Asp-tRNA(Asn)/Glu-tRNA(Gln) amidotransferase subunit GatC [Oscillospiraceae bacterium]